MSGPQLRRNRDFRILAITRGLSRLGTQASGIAFPLLVLRVTRSPADTGLVGFAEGVAVTIALLPGGAIADRWNRRAVMVISDAGCLVTMAVLCVAVLAQITPMAMIVPAAVVTAGLGASYGPAAGAALRLIVSDEQMPGAVAVNQARNAAAALIGPALGGLLFEISPSLPFLVDAGSYAISLLGTLALRTPLPAPAGGEAEGGGEGDGSLLRDILRGVTFIWRRRMLRFTMINSAVINFAFTGVLLSLIVTTVRDGSTGLTTGTVIAFVGVGSLAGSLLAPTASKRLSLRQAVVIFTWACTILVAAMALTTEVAVLAGLIAASALLVPALNVITASAQALMTPDALQGRVQSAVSFIAMSISPLGAAAAGFLLAHWRSELVFLAFAATMLALAAASTASRALQAPESASHAPAPRPAPAPAVSRPGPARGRS